jgi:thioester reductase-like protein
VGGLLEAAGRLWEQGLEVRRGQRRGQHLCRRVPLPAYPFERERFWIDAKPPQASETAVLRKQGKVIDWLYTPGWKQLSLSPLIHLGSRWVVFDDSQGVARRLTEQLRSAGNSCIRVARGAHFAKVEDNSYQLNPGDPLQAKMFWQELDRRNHRPEALLCCWAVDDCSSTFDTALAISQDLLTLLQSLAVNDAPRRLVLLSVGAHDVTGTETVSCSAAMLAGFCPVIRQEFPALSCRHLDLETVQSAEALAHAIAADVSDPDGPIEVAYRGRTRWVPSVELISNVSVGAPALRPRGVYLITGGLGGVGLAFARYLAQTVRARLVLLGRNAERQAQEDPVRSVIKKLKDYGAEVLAVSADVADAAAMSSAVSQTLQNFGELHGVVHAAGLSTASSFAPLQQIDRFECARQFQAKVAGTLALDKALANQPLDFFMATSSLAAILGGIGLGPYAAANRFMDMFVRRQCRNRALQRITINWDGWQFPDVPPVNARSTTGLQDFALSPEEGAEVFDAVLRCRAVPQVVVSTGSLEARMKKWLQLAVSDAANVQPQSMHARPELGVPYVKPRTEAEELLAEIMQRVLGIDRIGVDDNFFELGGDSLIATQFLAELRKIRQYSLPPLRALFEAGTVSRMAAMLKGTQEPAVLDRNIPDEAALVRDIRLGDDFVLGAQVEIKRAAPRRIFLTGATGFVGAFLIRELLRRTEAEIWCMVRDSNVESGARRILEGLNKWAPGPEPAHKRLFTVGGQLEERFLGLHPDLYEQIASETDSIYHSGALVNFVYPYDRLKPTNVDGTREMLRLAAHRRQKPFHYISTIDVFYSVNAARSGAVNEGVGIRQFGAPYGGYSQSKWVAEQIVSLAGDNGLPIAIYRSGFASADSKRAAGNTQDFLSRMIKGCILLGGAPNLELVLDMTPVDFIVQAVVHLSLRHDSLGKAFHLLNPTSWKVRDLAVWMKNFGYDVELMDYAEWRKRAIQLAAKDVQHPLHSVLSVFPEEVEQDLMTMPEFGRHNVLAALAGTDISCPVVDDELLTRYFTEFIRSGFLPAPASLTNRAKHEY